MKTADKKPKTYGTDLGSESYRICAISDKNTKKFNYDCAFLNGKIMGSRERDSYYRCYPTYGTGFMIALCRAMKLDMTAEAPASEMIIGKLDELYKEISELDLNTAKDRLMELLLNINADMLTANTSGVGRQFASISILFAVKNSALVISCGGGSLFVHKTFGTKCVDSTLEEAKPLGALREPNITVKTIKIGKRSRIFMCTNHMIEKFTVDGVCDVVQKNDDMETSLLDIKDKFVQSGYKDNISGILIDVNRYFGGLLSDGAIAAYIVTAMIGIGAVSNALYNHYGPPSNPQSATYKKQLTKAKRTVQLADKESRELELIITDESFNPEAVQEEYDEYVEAVENLKREVEEAQTKEEVEQAGKEGKQRIKLAESALRAALKGLKFDQSKPDTMTQIPVSTPTQTPTPTESQTPEATDE